ncbi:MAG: hypothetical protein H7141_11190 [Burkholderiales bacterium]|nr:hypothetical protein [Bacteroidia bacterium]
MKNQKLQNGLLILTLCLTFCVSAFAQDIMTLKNGNELSVKVTEIHEREIKYKDFANLEGPVRVIYKSDVFSIKYENGVKSVIDNNAPAVFNSVTVNQPTEVIINKVAQIPDPKFDKDSSDFAKTKRKSFGGPRVGLTYISPGTSADFIINDGKRPFITQFGWQFEGRLFTINNGMSGIVEFVPLIGGVEQGMFLPSASFLIGLRSGGKLPFEFAIGPNFSVGADYKKERIGSVGLVIALGTSFKSDNINFPINIALVPSIGTNHDSTDPLTMETKRTHYESGFKISLLAGFNYRKK